MSGGERAAGLVLAAGAAERHGPAFKLLLPYGEATVVRAAVEALLTAGMDPVLVVVGHRAEEVRAAVRHSRVRVVDNPGYADGIGTSLAAGIQALRRYPAAEGVVILLGDEPGVSVRAITTVVDAWRDLRPPVTRAIYRDRPGHPVVVDRSLFRSLEDAEGDRGLSVNMRRRGLRPHAVKVDEAAPVDIDTPTDYARALRRGGG